MKTINIRFLKQGLLEIEVPEDTVVDEMIKLGKKALDEASDQDLVMAMYDCMPQFSKLSVSRFDEGSFQVEAIEVTQSNGDYDVVYTTQLWEEYTNV